jgi:hypothetical protein
MLMSAGRFLCEPSPFFIPGRRILGLLLLSFSDLFPFCADFSASGSFSLEVVAGGLI